MTGSERERCLLITKVKIDPERNYIPVVLENAYFRVHLFLFRVRRDDAHGRSLQRGAPTVGALGDAAMDENGRVINMHFQVSRVYTNGNKLRLIIVR